MPTTNIIHGRIVKLRRPPNLPNHPPRHRFRIRYCIVALLLTCASVQFQVAPTSMALGADCADVDFIFARGSGENLDSGTYRAWEDSIRSELNQEPPNQDLKYHFYELGRHSHGGHQYPAVSVSGDLEGIINLGGAAISGGEAFAFGESVSAGSAELQAYISQTSQLCPQTKFVLGGYSQGAMILTRSLPSLDPNKIIYAATFGDPKLYLPEGAHSRQDDYDIPEACYGRNLSEYREYVPDCYAYAGLLGPAVPYQPLGYSGKLGTWCNLNDIMCSSGSSIRDHISYVADNLYADAARNIVRAIRVAFVDRLDDPPTLAQNIHELAVLVDATASMANGHMYWRLTEQAKKLAQEVIASGGRVAFFIYRDLIDGLETKKLCDFTCTLDDLQSAIDGVELRLGDDQNESALSAMNYTINALNWTENTQKSLLVLTDAGLHEPDRDNTTSADVVTSSQAKGGVKIFAPVYTPFMQDFANVTTSTGGKVFNLMAGFEQVEEAILPSPIAQLAQTNYEGPANSRFTFDASGSQVFAGADLIYDWDLDGNGVFELKDAGPIVSQTFKYFEGDIFVRVTDRTGHTHTASAYVKAVGMPAVKSSTLMKQSYMSAQITDLDLEASNQTDASLTVHAKFSTNAERVLLLMDEAIIGFIDFYDGRGVVTIKDFSASSSITLVPYSTTGRRGISSTVSLKPQPEEVAPPAGSMTSIPSTIIPKAPSAGVRSVKRKEISMTRP